MAPANASKSQTKSEKRSGNTLYQELAFHDTDASIAEGEEGGDITGNLALFSILVMHLRRSVIRERCD